MKNLLNRAKRFAPACVGTSALALGSVAKTALCAGTADPGVTAGFQSATDGITATLSAVAPIVVPIMIALLGWKYGRKIFAQIAK